MINEKEIKKIVREFYPLTPAVERLINIANHDLHYGPIQEGELVDNEFYYPGFSKALDAIEDELPNIDDLYIEIFCGYAQENEPAPDEDPETGEIIDDFSEDWVKITRKEVLSILVGKELHQYL